MPYTQDMFGGGQSQPLIVAMRGRNPENPSDRTPGIETEQRLEPNTNGTANTITSVQKDNLVLERNISLTEVRMGDNKSTIIIDDLYENRDKRVYEEYALTLRSDRSRLKKIEINTISTKGKKIDIASTILAEYERSNMTGFNADNCVIEREEIPTIKIRQATKQGYVECKVGGGSGFKLSYFKN